MNVLVWIFVVFLGRSPWVVKMIKGGFQMLCHEISRCISMILLVLMVFSSAGCSLGARYIFSPSNDKVSTPNHAGLSYEEVWFQSADGIQLNGWFVPGDPDRPLVLYFHGNAANITHRVPNIKYLHSLGLPVFIFDYRGFGVSEGQPLDEEDLYQDARGALKWLEGRGWKTDRMVYYGRSLGAAVALQLALESSPAGIVLEAPFTSLREIAKQMMPVAYFIAGWWAIGERFDNLSKASQLLQPLLILHGDRDQIVPYQMSLRLFAQANQPKTIVIIPGGRHSNSFQINGEVYSTAWKNFLSKLGSVGGR